MKKTMLLVLLFGLMIIGFCACDKNSNFNPQGGELPTHYIKFDSGVFTPSHLSEANGSNFTFLNMTTVPITITGDDTSILKQVLIAPNSYYFFKPDTIPASPVQIYIPYHCVETPAARGVIILNP